MNGRLPRLALNWWPMALGAIISGLIAALKFLGLGGSAQARAPLDLLHALSRQIRKSQSEAELAETPTVGAIKAEWLGPFSSGGRL